MSARRVKSKKVTEPKLTRFDALVQRCKNNKWIVPVLMLVMILVGIAQFTDAVDKISMFFTSDSKKSAAYVIGNIAESNSVKIGGNNFGQVAGGSIINSTTVNQFQSEQAIEEWQPPELPSGCKWVTVSLGSATIMQTVSQPAWNPIVGMSGNMLALVRSNRLHCDAEVTFDGINSFTISNMSFSGNMPPSWDRNWSSNAFEIVGSDGLPVLQLFYKQPEHLVVNGLFPLVNGSVLGAFEDGFQFGNGKQVLERFKNRKPLFKYPGWQHRGKFAEK